MTVDLTADTTGLAHAAADVVRLVPGRLVDPVLSGLLLTATADGVTLGATDRERFAHVTRGAVVHETGRVLVPSRPLAETLRAVDQQTVRLVVEGSRLAIRTPTARFALPLLDADVHPGTPQPPATAGTVDGAMLATALSTVAATASRDDALALFTGVRVRGDGDQLVLLATDRYRMALARLPWRPGANSLDALVPASLLAEIARQAAGCPDVTVHADTDRFALSYGETTVSTSVLDGSFLSESKIDTSVVDTTVELDADALAGALRRVALYADVRGVLQLEPGDGEIRLRSADRSTGEAEEYLKADVTGSRTGPWFQARYLTDALRGFAGSRVRIAIQPGMRATTVTATDPGPVRLTYIVMPMLPPKS